MQIKEKHENCQHYITDKSINLKRSATIYVGDHHQFDMFLNPISSVLILHIYNLGAAV